MLSFQISCISVYFGKVISEMLSIQISCIFMHFKFWNDMDLYNFRAFQDFLIQIFYVSVYSKFWISVQLSTFREQGYIVRFFGLCRTKDNGTVIRELDFGFCWVTIMVQLKRLDYQIVMNKDNSIIEKVRFSTFIEQW